MSYPLVSIGLPVFNGDNFIAEAIESFVKQTFTDWELVISDNASTDKTEEICRRWCNKDSRIRYYRNAENLGSSANYTKAFEKTTGKYFKWSAHDDIYLPTYLEKCLEVLESDESIVLCHSRISRIDSSGTVIAKHEPAPSILNPDPYARFCSSLEKAWSYVWGLGRRSTIAKTRLLGPYVHHDIPYISHLSLHGKIYELPDVLCLIREHPDRYSQSFEGKFFRDRIGWYDPALENTWCFPMWRLLKEHFLGVILTPLSINNRFKCIRELVSWSFRHRTELWHEAMFPLQQLPGGPTFATTIWNWNTKRIVNRIDSIIQDDAHVILVDEDKLGLQAWRNIQLTPFPEQSGCFWGLPISDEAAISELERLRSEGAEIIVFTKPSLWWLAHYAGLTRHLDRKYSLKFSDKLIIAYDLHAPKVAALS